MYVSSLIGQKILFSYYFCLFVSNPKQICSKTFHNRIRGTKSMYYDLKLFYLRKASSYCYICFSPCRLLGLWEVYSKNQSTYSYSYLDFLFTFCRSLQGPPRPPRTQSQIDMVSQSNELSSITTAKKLPRSSSEPKVDKHLKRESRALKSRSVHFDGTGMSNTICDVGFLSKRGQFLTKKFLDTGIQDVSTRIQALSQVL